MNHWIVIGIAAVFIGGYVALIIWGRKKQRQFEEQYESAKESHEVFVLIKRTVRKKPESGMFRFFKFKTYELVGRVNLSRSIKGIQMSRMQNVTFRTTKEEYKKVEPHHSYRMDIAGDYIGYVKASSPQRKWASKGSVKAWAGNLKKRLLGRKDDSGEGKARARHKERNKGKKHRSKIECHDSSGHLHQLDRPPAPFKQRWRAGNLQMEP